MQWRRRARQASVPSSSTGGRTTRRAGSSGASGAAGCRRAPFTHVVGYRTPTAAEVRRRSTGRGRHAPRSGHLRLLLDLADPGRTLPGQLSLSRRRNGATVCVPAGSDPADRIGCQLSVMRTSIKERQKVSLSKSFIVLLNCYSYAGVKSRSQR